MIDGHKRSLAEHFTPWFMLHVRLLIRINIYDGKLYVSLVWVGLDEPQNPAQSVAECANATLHGSSGIGWTLGAPIKSSCLLLQSQSANPVPVQSQEHTSSSNLTIPPFLHTPEKLNHDCVQESKCLRQVGRPTVVWCPLLLFGPCLNLNLSKQGVLMLTASNYRD